MARRKPPGVGKTRTREHILADLAVNAVERQVLLAGFTLERIAHDYGYDAIVLTFSLTGEPKPGWLLLQIKGTEHPQWSSDQITLSFRLQRSDLVTWLREPSPVMLCLYVEPLDAVYYVWIQRYFAALEGFDLFAIGDSITLLIDAQSRFSPDTARWLSEQLEIQQQHIREALDE